MAARFKDAFLTALIAAILALPLAGARTIDGVNGLAVEWHIVDVGVAAALIFIGRLMLGLVADGYGVIVAVVSFLAAIASVYTPMPSHFLQAVAVLGGLGISARAIFYLLFPRARGWNTPCNRLCGNDQEDKRTKE